MAPLDWARVSSGGRRGGPVLIRWKSLLVLVLVPSVAASQLEDAGSRGERHGVSNVTLQFTT